MHFTEDGKILDPEDSPFIWNLKMLIETHDSSTSKRLAEEVLVFIVRHISKPMPFPVAMYSSASVSGAKLYPVVFEVVEASES